MTTQEAPQLSARRRSVITYLHAVSRTLTVVSSSVVLVAVGLVFLATPSDQCRRFVAGVAQASADGRLDELLPPLALTIGITFATVLGCVALAGSSVTRVGKGLATLPLAAWVAVNSLPLLAALALAGLLGIVLSALERVLAAGTLYEEYVEAVKARLRAIMPALSGRSAVPR